MKRKAWWVMVLVAGGMLFSALGCIEEDEEKNPKAVTWEDVARAIDLQLGLISQGTTLNTDCNGQGQAIGFGAHCKDQLKGTVSAATVRQYVQLKNDTVLFEGDTDLFDGDTAFWDRGLELAGNPCTQDLDDNDTFDYHEVCATGNLACADLGKNVYRLTYENCVWKEKGPRTFNLDGEIYVTAYVTPLSEQIVVRRFRNFTGVEQATNAAYTLNGAVTRYLKLDPFSGVPLIGTTGGLDGMWIIKLTASVDMDGAGAAFAGRTYSLNAAWDNEDGWVFLSGSSKAVWLGAEDNSVPGTNKLTFYAKGLPYDGIPTGGCKVDVTDLNAADRTFDIISRTTAYPDTGCIADDDDVEY